jgi:hypothetical protein
MAGRRLSEEEEEWRGEKEWDEKRGKKRGRGLSEY